MATKTAKLLSEAAELSDKDFSALLGKLHALRKVGAAEQHQDSDQATEWYGCMSALLHDMRGVRVMPPNVFKQTKHWSAFTRAAEEAECFIEALAQERVKKLAVRQWCCRLIINYLIECNVPFEWSGMSWAMNSLPAIVDHYFPGYLASGLMTTVLESLFKGNKPRLALKLKTK